jgi:hypothetical protein
MRNRWIATLALLALLGAGAARAGQPSIEEQGGRLPDLTVRARDLEAHFLSREQGRLLLRFPTTIVNVGEGPLEVLGRRQEPEAPRMAAVQVVYDAQKQVVTEVPIGEFEYHEEHGHWHLMSVAEYRLLDADGKVLATSGKVSFCLFDSVLERPDLKDAPRSRGYEYCSGDRTFQSLKSGISVGWADVYDSHLEGQSLDVTEIPTGEYRLEVEVDPDRVLHEKSRGNNVVSVPIQLDGESIPTSRRVRAAEPSGT